MADDFYPPYLDNNEKEHNVTDSDYWKYLGHGTAVAGVAAASRNGQGMHGVAFDAEILNAPEFTYMRADGSFGLKDDWIDAFPKNPGIRVVNCSWSSSFYATEIFEYYSLSSIEDFLPAYSPALWFENLCADNDLLICTGTANADYASDGNIDMTGSGTSAATPFASGAAVLVQQAFPYMTAKQIGDVILSTANPNVTSVPGYTVLLQRESALSWDKYLNILYFDGKPRTAEEQKADCLAYLSRFRPKEYETYAESPIYTYYNVPMEALIGQGVLDAGKAVDGPGALNARRMDKSDISSAYTVGGVKTPQALYAVDTAGYDSVWSNDIKEVRVGLLAADSSEEDLKTRYKFYTENWLEREKHGYDGNVIGAGFVKAYIDFYNDNAQASGLADLPVGLVKSGEGRLSLTGNNTYKGASIARQGTLSIDGSVAGDAYSVEEGTIAGCGTSFAEV